MQATLAASKSVVFAPIPWGSTSVAAAPYNTGLGCGSAWLRRWGGGSGLGPGDQSKWWQTFTYLSIHPSSHPSIYLSNLKYLNYLASYPSI